MNTGALTMEGQYLDGLTPVPRPVTILLSRQGVVVIGSAFSYRGALAQLEVSPRIAAADRFINLPNGGQIQCQDNPLLDLLPQHSVTEGPVAWLEARLSVAVAGIALVFAILGGGYFFGLPVVAENVANRIPLETEKLLGEEVLSWLDQNQWLQPSKVQNELRFFIEAEFREMHKGLQYSDQYRLEFREASLIGANAFALPGGIIVITDDMVDLSESLDEIAAILAHEIGHIEKRHTMRHILQNSVIAAATTAITGDAASLSVAVSALPALVAQASYSREFESEADSFAFELLLQRNRSPAAFADLMERLTEEADDSAAGFDFLATHPVSSERIQNARNAARR